MAALNHRTHRRRRGLATIETAIVLPLLLLLTAGILEYGWMFLKYQEVTNATRHGARVGATVDAGSAEVNQAIADAMTASGLGGSGYTVTISPSVDGLSSGALFTVTVSVNYDNIGLDMPLTPTPANVSASLTMMKEGP